MFPWDSDLSRFDGGTLPSRPDASGQEPAAAARELGTAAAHGHLAAFIKVEPVELGHDLAAVAVARRRQPLPVLRPVVLVQGTSIDRQLVPVFDLFWREERAPAQRVQHAVVGGVLAHDLLELVGGEAKEDAAHALAG